MGMGTVTGTRLVGLAGGAMHDQDHIGTILVGVALVALGVGVLVMTDGLRARLGGVALLLWGATLFFPGALAGG